MGNAKIDKNHIIYFYLCIYFVINLCFLTDYPYIHSDEPWLSALSQSMLNQEDLSVTEPFFDVYDRNPHAIRLLFHSIQIAFIKVFGHTPFSMRLISLLFSIFTLYFFYRLCRIILKSNTVSLLGTIILSLDIHYLFTSHFARQEIIILFVLVLATYQLLKNIQNHTPNRDILIGAIIGLSIGIHPNSFMVAATIGAIYLFYILQKKVKAKNLIYLILTISVFALFFILISIYFDPNFFKNYLNNGVKFGVQKNILDKIFSLKDFYLELFTSNSKTYPVPNIKFQLITLAVGLIATFLCSFKKTAPISTEAKSILLGVIFLQLATIIIGRYNVTSIIFIFPFAYILIINIIKLLPSGKYPIILILLLITIVNTHISMPSYSTTYDEYMDNISQYIGKNETVLANVNTAYYFEEGKVYDYRNLRYISEKSMTIEEYIIDRKINYIIYSDELDFIVENKPHYNLIYGNPDYYYDELKAYLKDNCQLLYSFTDSIYSTTIGNMVDKNQWKVHIYKVIANR